MAAPRLFAAALLLGIMAIAAAQVGIVLNDEEGAARSGEVASVLNRFFAGGRCSIHLGRGCSAQARELGSALLRSAPPAHIFPAPRVPQLASPWRAVPLRILSFRRMPSGSPCLIGLVRHLDAAQRVQCCVFPLFQSCCCPANLPLGPRLTAAAVTFMPAGCASAPRSPVLLRPPSLRPPSRLHRARPRLRLACCTAGWRRGSVMCPRCSSNMAGWLAFNPIPSHKVITLAYCLGSAVPLPHLIQPCMHCRAGCAGSVTKRHSQPEWWCASSPAPHPTAASFTEASQPQTAQPQTALAEGEQQAGAKRVVVRHLLFVLHLLAGRLAVKLSPSVTQSGTIVACLVSTVALHIRPAASRAACIDYRAGCVPQVGPPERSVPAGMVACQAPLLLILLQPPSPKPPSPKPPSPKPPSPKPPSPKASSRAAGMPPAQRHRCDNIGTLLDQRSRVAELSSCKPARDIMQDMSRKVSQPIWCQPTSPSPLAAPIAASCTKASPASPPAALPLASQGEPRGVCAGFKKAVHPCCLCLCLCSGCAPPHQSQTHQETTCRWIQEHALPAPPPLPPPALPPQASPPPPAPSPPPAAPLNVLLRNGYNYVLLGSGATTASSYTSAQAACKVWRCVLGPCCTGTIRLQPRGPDGTAAWMSCASTRPAAGTLHTGHQRRPLLV